MRELLPAARGRLRPARLIDAFTFEIDILAKRTAAQLAHHPGYRAVQTIPGVGPYWVRCSWLRSAT